MIARMSSVQRTLMRVLRILSGDFRSRPLAVPRGRDLTRPMGSRTRGALFDLLRGWFDGTTVLDLFAGVGTLGLEAASRGAGRVICVERDRFIARLLRQNIDTFRCEDRVTVVEGDVLSEGTFAAIPRPVDVVFCDPPFALVMEAAALPPPAPRHERVDQMDVEENAVPDEDGDIEITFDPDAEQGAEPMLGGFGRDRNAAARGEFDLANDPQRPLRRPRRARRGEPEVDLVADALARDKANFQRELARFDAMLARLRPLFGDKGFLALRLPEPRRGEAGVIPGFDGPEIHGYGDQQWIHLYAPSPMRGPIPFTAGDASAPFKLADAGSTESSPAPSSIPFKGAQPEERT